VGDRLADTLSTSDLRPLLNETSLDEALLTLLIEALLTETVSGVVGDISFPNSRIRSLLDLLVLDALCDDEESTRRKPDDRAEEPEELRAMEKCAGLRALPGTPAALEKDDPCRLPGRAFDMEDLLNREAFELLRIAGMTEYITYMNVLDVCSEWFHEFLTLKDAI
jgi:hypothetical protein